MRRTLVAMELEIYYLVERFELVGWVWLKVSLKSRFVFRTLNLRRLFSVAPRVERKKMKEKSEQKVPVDPQLKSLFLEHSMNMKIINGNKLSYEI